MPDYTMAQLAEMSELPARTIRYYVAEGLVPSPGREGAATRYPESTLARLRLIARLRDAHESLAQIRARLAELTDQDVAVLSAGPIAPAASGSALDYIRGVLLQRPPLLAGETAAIYASAAPPATHLSPRAALAAPGAAMPAMPAPRGGPAVEARFRQARLMTGFAGATPEGSVPQMPAPTVPPSSGERSQWDRIALADGIELHVRRPLSHRDDRLVERLVALAGELQKEDP